MKRMNVDRYGRERKDRDAFGAAVGTTRYKVNAAMSRKKWQAVEDVAESAGVSVESALLYLRRMVRLGQFEKQKRIAYRVAPR